MLIKTFTKKLDGLKFAVHTNCLIWHIQREKKLITFGSSVVPEEKPCPIYHNLIV